MATLFKEDWMTKYNFEKGVIKLTEWENRIYYQGRGDGIDEYVKILVTEFDFDDTDIQKFIEIGENLKQKGGIMGYIEQTDVGNVYITDINDWFATLSNLNRECKNYTDSEIRYKEILAEHDKQIREEVIAEISREIRLLYGNEYEKQIRADTVEEYRKALKTILEEESCIHSIDLDIEASKVIDGF